MDPDEPQIMVSICCTTYNHAEYIAKALDGFLAQKTRFAYEILIGNDCSSDATETILKDYSSSYPDKIHVLTSEKNIGSKKNQMRIFELARGKYIALCDGDDYWIDPLKLQKQVDFMESHPDCVICCHYSRVTNENGDVMYENERPEKLEFSYEDVLLGKKNETRTSSMVFANSFCVQDLGRQEWYHKTFGCDTFLKLYLLAKEKGKICVLPEVMSVYRWHRNGVWSMIDSKVRKNQMISDFNIIIEHFEYSANQKKALRNFYLNQFLLFEIKNLKFQGAINTLIKLV